MSASVPLNTMVASAVPSPVVKVRPVCVGKVKVPWATESVTVSSPPLASTSETLRPEIERAVLAMADWAPGTTSTGASLTGVTVIVATASGEVRPVESVALNVNVPLPAVGFWLMFS